MHTDRIFSWNLSRSSTKYVAAFGGYQGGHLKTIEGFDGEIDWDFLAQDLQEPRA